MEMNEIVSLLAALIAGFVLGAIFFGGLWLTVNCGLRLKRYGLFFATSLIVRVTAVLLGFYYVGADSLPKMLICLLGFLIARFVITRITANCDSVKAEFAKEVSDET